jgi:hypothetical protein
MRAPAVLALVLFALSARMTAVGEPQAEPNPDFPSTEVRFGWLRQERQHPDQPSRRPRPKHDKLVPNNFDSLRLAIQDLTMRPSPTATAIVTRFPG